MNKEMIFNLIDECDEWNNYKFVDEKPTSILIDKAELKKRIMGVKTK